MRLANLDPAWRHLEGWPSWWAVEANATSTELDTVRRELRGEGVWAARWWNYGHGGTLVVPPLVLELAVKAAQGPARVQLEAAQAELDERALLALADELPE